MNRFASTACRVIDRLSPRDHGTPVLMYHSISTRPSKLSIDPDESSAIVAYPRSRASDESLAVVAQLGVTMAFTGGKRVCLPARDPRFALPRIGVTRETTMAELELMLSPTYNRLKRVRTGARRHLRRLGPRRFARS